MIFFFLMTAIKLKLFQKSPGRSSRPYDLLGDKAIAKPSIKTKINKANLVDNASIHALLVSRS